jgi:hypothetical protein
LSIYAASTKKMTRVQLPVILRIFEENQNLVDMHTSIMCINILQNIKAVAPKQDVYTHNGGVHIHMTLMVRRGHHLCLTDTFHF